MAGRTFLALMVLALLTGCGARAGLQPKAGKAMPVAPYGRSSQPGSAELLKLAPQARPIRSEELQTRSEERPDDPFDLPPKE